MVPDVLCLYFFFWKVDFSDLRGWKKLVPDVFFFYIFVFWKVYFSDLRGWKKLVPDVLFLLYIFSGRSILVI